MEPDHRDFYIAYQRPIRSRYLDPIELIWYATARRLGLHVRRDPAIFSMTDGTGLLALGPEDTLDPDDSAAQMIFHEFCHWITNGLETFSQRDWGFALDGELDWREHACLRLQATLAGRYGLRQVLAPTSPFRGYYDLIPADPLEPLPGWPLEDRVVARAVEAIGWAAGAPWGGPLAAALEATARVRAQLVPFLGDYTTDLDADRLPSLWGRGCSATDSRRAREERCGGAGAGEEERLSSDAQPGDLPHPAPAGL